MAVIKDLSNMDFDISFAGLETDLSETFKNILSSVGNYVSNGTISVIDNSISALSRILIGFAAFVYFLIDMDHIRNGIKNFLKNYSMKMFDYVKELDDQMKRYLNGLVRIMVISVIEYTFAYTIIGHPNAILLGLLAGFGNLIPYFGGMANNCLAAITALAISPSLFIKTIILFVILSWVDGYVINPTVYGKTNSIHPLIVILSVFAGGILWGIMGIVISFPVAIIIVTTYKFFRNDISNITTKKRNKKIKLTNK
jgi:predicted PurR-regulated permease PerM